MRSTYLTFNHQRAYPYTRTDGRTDGHTDTRTEKNDYRLLGTNNDQVEKYAASKNLLMTKLNDLLLTRYDLYVIVIKCDTRRRTKRLPSLRFSTPIRYDTIFINHINSDKQTIKQYNIGFGRLAGCHRSKMLTHWLPADRDVFRGPLRLPHPLWR